MAEPEMDPSARKAAVAARGFMPTGEGDALWQAAIDAARAVPGRPLLEVGTYCGKSAIWLGDAARQRDTVLFTLDHHRGSEENQPGWEWHEPDLVDPDVGRLDTLPTFRRTIADAGVEPWVVAIIGDSPTVARYWSTPLALVFIDGGHSRRVAHRDYDAWSRLVAVDGFLCIHDVFPNRRHGGRPPFEIYSRALSSRRFVETAAVGSLRVLQRIERPASNR